MTPSEIEQLVNDGPSVFMFSLPSVGYVGTRTPAYFAVALENKVAVYTGQDRDPLCFVFSEATKVGEGLVFQAVRPFPAPMVTFTRLRATDPDFGDFADDAADVLTSFNDNPANLHEHAVAALNSLETWEEPPHNTTVHYVEWLTFEADLNPVPRGIIAISESGDRLVGIVFPGFEDEAAQWDKFKGLPRDPSQALNGLSMMLDRYTAISEPMEAVGHSWDDATTRALHRFGALYFNESKRSAF